MKINIPAIQYNGRIGYQDSIPIQAILYSYYIKYSKLRELTKEAFAGSDSDMLYVYIDMYDIVKNIYHRSLIGENSLNAVKENLLTSSILNLCAHLRNFYWNGYGVHTKFFIMFSTYFTDLSSECRGTSLLSKVMINNPHADKVLGWNVNMLNMLCPYFPDVYFVQGTVDTCIMTMNLIMNQRSDGDNTPGIIISKDTMMWQIPCHYPEIAVFRPRKKNDEDISFCVDQSNVVSMWRSTVKRLKTPVECFVAPQHFSLYLALTSFKDRDLSSYYDARKACKIISDLLQRNIILPGYNYPTCIVDILNSLSKPVSITDLAKDHLIDTSLVMRYCAIDLYHLAMKYSLIMPESKYNIITSNKYDPKGIEDINNEHFVDNPINFIHLFQGGT